MEITLETGLHTQAPLLQLLLAVCMQSDLIIAENLHSCEITLENVLQGSLQLKKEGTTLVLSVQLLEPPLQNNQ